MRTHGLFPIFGHPGGGPGALLGRSWAAWGSLWALSGRLLVLPGAFEEDPRGDLGSAREGCLKKARFGVEICLFGGPFLVHVP